MEKPFALIVEDDRDIVALFRHVLDVAGYHTEIVLDGKDAMDRLLSHRPDIVLLDLQLPSMSGMEILQRMRADEQLSTVPVVVITAYSHYSDSLPVEPDLLLLKPVDINQLSNLVQRLLATHGAMREPPRDKITQLYTISFFTVRLTFALERIKQSGIRRFGVMFADVDPYDKLKQKLSEKDLNHFLGEVAERFKSTLRPTDTVAWWENSCFLNLIEDVSTPDVPLKIAGRVMDSLGSYLEQRAFDINMRVNLGVLICDWDYKDADQILEDIKFSRELLRSGPAASPAIYDRDILFAKREA
jgi:two-component system cell cycle response regulator DivK